MPKETVTARYYNSDGIGTAIVAVITYTSDGEVFDWAAYIGGSRRGAERQEWAVEDVARTGCKLWKEDGVHFFPHLPPEKWRP